MDFLLRQRLSVTAERDLRNIHFKNKDMRIKINDKIYRLKEIESGVDSLMELVEEPKYKEGDFVYEDKRIMIVKSYPSNYHAIVLPCIGVGVVYDSSFGVNFSVPTFRYATEEEKQILIDAMAKEGKRWNEEKKCVEDIPVRKFKKGDKVRIKYGVSSKTHRYISPTFLEEMDELIGTTMTVSGYTHENGYVVCKESGCRFLEDWLEHCEGLKEGDLAIFWDSDQAEARIGAYNQFYDGSPFPHEDHIGNGFKNAVKFESKKQFKRFIKGEL